MKSLHFFLLSLLALNFQSMASEVNWSSSELTLAEGIGNVSVDVVLDTNATDNVIVDYTIVNGTAIGGGLDIDLASEGNIVIASGTNSQVLSFNIISDNVLEDLTESLTLQLSSASGANVGSPSDLTLNIVDDESTSGISVFFGWNQLTDKEDHLESTVPVYLSAPSRNTVTVDVLYGGDIDNADYNSSSNTITFAPGETQANFTLGLLDDSDVEETEDLILSLSNPSGANILGGSDSFTYTILDNDGVTINVVSSEVGVLEGSSLSLYIRLDQPAPQTITVDYTITDLSADYGSDYSGPQSGTLTFFSGDQEKSLSFSTTSDGFDEGRERFTLDLSNPSGASLGASSATVTIRDKDPILTLSTVSFADSNSLTANENSNGFNLYLRSDQTIPQAITAQLEVSGNATLGEDFTIPATISVPANSSFGSVSMVIQDDLLNEGQEQFNVKLISTDAGVIGSSDNVKVTIVDNDVEDYEAYLSPSLSTSPSEYNSQGALFVYTTQAVNRDVTYVIEQISGNATLGEDYTLGSNTVTISAGSSSGHTPLVIVDDLLLEDSESFTLGIQSASHGLIGSANTTTLTIQDNDEESYEAYLFSSISSLNENDGSTSISLYTTQTVNRDVTYVIDQISGNATLGEDYTLSSNTLTIPAFSSFTSTTVNLTNDGNTEGDEDFTLAISSANFGAIRSSNTITLNLIDDDVTPEVNVSSSPSSVTEGAFSTSFTMILDREFSSTVDLTLTSSGNAVEGVDFTLSDNSPSFSPGSTTRTIFIYPTDDSSIEGDEEILLTITTATNASLGSSTNLSVSLVDNDDDPVTSEAYLSSSTSSVAENGSYSVRVVLNNSSSQALTYVIGDMGGNAILGEDYTLSSGNTITVSAFSTASSFYPVTITNDGNTEGDEVITLGILSASAGTISSSNTTSVTLLDDEVIPEVFFSGIGSAQETTSSLSVFAYLDRVYSGNVSVILDSSGVATLGEDYTLSSNVLTFSPYSTSTLISLLPVNDTEVENTESLTLSMTSADNAIIRSGSETFTVNLYDNDNPTLSISAVSSQDESSDQVFSASLSNAADQTVYANLEVTGGTAVFGEDFSSNAMTIAFAPGSTFQYLDFHLIDDDISESTETLEVSVLQVANASLSTSQSTVSITDNDPSALVSVSRFSFTSGNTITQSEGSNTDIYFRLDQALEQDVYVDYSLSGTATRTVDYAMSDNGLVRIPAGSTSAYAFRIYGIDDQADEAEERVLIDIDTVYGAGIDSTNNQFVWKVQDDDEYTGPLLSFGSAPGTVMENASSNLSITVELNLPQGQDVTFTVTSSSNSTATLGTDFLLDTSTQTLSAGEDTLILELDPVDDSDLEGNEIIELVLQVISGANLDSPSTHTIVLADRDTFTLTAVDHDVIDDRFIHNDSQTITLALTGGEGPFSAGFGSNSQHSQVFASGSFSLTSHGNLVYLNVPSIFNPSEISLIVEATSGNLSTSANLTLLPPLELSSSSISVRVGEVGSLVQLTGGSTSFATPTRTISTSGILQLIKRQQLLSISPVTGAIVSADEFSPTVVNITLTDAIFNDESVSLSVTVLPDTTNGTTIEHRQPLPAYSGAKDYRLVGFPMKDMSADRLLTTLVPTLGPLGDVNWVLYQYLGASGNYREVSPSSQLQTGQGFWMASTTPRLPEWTMIAVADNTQVQVSLDAGWNILGNPYAVALQKGDFEVANENGQWVELDSSQDLTAKTLWTYENGTYRSSGNLRIGQGAWLYVWNSEGADLRMDPALADAVVGSSNSSSNILDEIDTGSSSNLLVKARAASRPEPFPPAPPSGQAVSSGASSGGGGCLLSKNRR